MYNHIEKPTFTGDALILPGLERRPSPVTAIGVITTVDGTRLPILRDGRQVSNRPFSLIPVSAEQARHLIEEVAPKTNKICKAVQRGIRDEVGSITGLPSSLIGDLHHLKLVVLDGDLSFLRFDIDTYPLIKAVINKRRTDAHARNKQAKPEEARDVKQGEGNTTSRRPRLIRNIAAASAVLALSTAIPTDFQNPPTTTSSTSPATIEQSVAYNNLPPDIQAISGVEFFLLPDGQNPTKQPNDWDCSIYPPRGSIESRVVVTQGQWSGTAYQFLLSPPQNWQFTENKNVDLCSGVLCFLGGGEWLYQQPFSIRFNPDLANNRYTCIASGLPLDPPPTPTSPPIPGTPA